jgi:DNA repair exonuclease SbcCD ATPase subunit
MEISIKRLREYIENDKEYQQFKTVPEETLHQYARLHYIRCWDIENVLNENQQLKEQVDNCISNEMKQQLEISNLRQENQQLKEKYLNAVSDYETTKSENQQLKDKINSILCDSNRLVNSNEKLDTIVEKYKSILHEIREYIKEKERDGTLWSVKATDDLLQILDKVKE